MSSVPSGRYGGRSAEDRRAQRRSRLLEAGLDIVGTDGWQAATVRAVCARAKLTPRYFYESFASREALLLEVFDGIVAEATGRVLAAIAAAPENAEAKARAAIEAFVDVLLDDPRKARVAFTEAMGDEALMRRRLQTLRLFSGLVADQARAFYRSPPEADGLVEVTAYLLVGGLAELLIAWLDGDLRTTREALVDDCAELFAAVGEAATGIARRRAG